MRNTRLSALLETFSKKELRDFRKFIQSPFFNQRTDVVQLFEWVSVLLKTQQAMPDKEQIFQRLYGVDTDYDDHKVRMVMSFLLKLAERYLVYQSIISEEVKVKTRLAAVYRQRNLSKHFEKAIREANDTLAKSELSNAVNYQMRQELQMEEYRYQSSQSRIADHNLQAVTDNLDIVYFSNKLRQACLLRSHQAVYKKEYRYGLIDAILDWVVQQNLLELPAIALYYYGYQSLVKPEEPFYFGQLKKLLVKKGNLFPKNEIADLYLLAINFCIKKYNDGEQRYLEDEFDLYKDGIEKGYLINNGVLSRFAFRNVVTTGLVLQQEDWVEQFIYAYKDHLEETHRKSMYSFSLARLAFQRKQFGKALQLLQQSEYKDLLLNLAAKGVVLKVYYETASFDALYSHLDAMQRFIRRKNIIGYHRAHYMNTIQFTRKLIEATSSSAYQKLKQEIEAEKAVAEKSWLLEQC